MLNALILSALNKILQHNEGSINLLKQYTNHSFKLSIAGLVGFYAAIDIDGLFVDPSEQKYNKASTQNHEPYEPYHQKYTVEITIPLACANYVVNQDKLAAFQQINFTGNTQFGRELLEILSKLHFSGVYDTLPPLLQPVMIKLEQVILVIAKSIILLQHNASHSISEYLLYETQDLVTRFEIEEFCNQIDELNNRVELLRAKIDHLQTVSKL